MTELMDFWAALPRTAEEGGARLFRNLIERSVFFSDVLPAGERAAAYQEQCAGTTARVTPLTSETRAHAVSYAVPPVRIHFFDNAPFLFERTREAYAADGLDFIAIQHIAKGHAIGRFEGCEAYLAQGCVYAIDMSRSCAIEETAPVRLMLAILPRQVALECLGDLGHIHGRVVAPDAAKPYSDVFYDLAPRLEDWPRAEADAVFETLRPALTRIMSTPAIAEPKLLARVRAFVDANLGDRSLKPQGIADGLGVSRSSLYETLKAVNGIERFIYERRLAAVHASLASRTEVGPSIATLAVQYGFASPDHLTKLFRQKYGIAPSRLRAAGERDN